MHTVFYANHNSKDYKVLEWGLTLLTSQEKLYVTSHVFVSLFGDEKCLYVGVKKAKSIIHTRGDANQAMRPRLRREVRASGGSMLMPKQVCILPHAPAHAYNYVYAY